MSSQTANELALSLYTNPLSVQTQLLRRLEQEVLEGDTVPDGNNVVSFLLEYMASMTAGFATKTMDAFNDLYPSRAQTAAALYRHMSDLDYVNMFSIPATVKVSLLLNREFLLNYAVPLDDSNGSVVNCKLTIPETTVFRIDNIPFTLHYPVDLYVRKVYKVTTNRFGHETKTLLPDSCTFYAKLDLSVNNPLYTATSETLETHLYEQNGAAIVSINLELFQLQRTTTEKDVITSAGFVEKLPYTGKFYALRVFHLQQGVWQELPQTFAELQYDPEVATVLVQVLTDTSEVKLHIPQVYLNRGLVGSRCRIIIYTSQGEVSIDFQSLSTEQYEVVFFADQDASVSKFSQPLQRVPYAQLLPAQEQLHDGSDGLSFAEMRDRVLHDSSYKLLITSLDLTNYFKDQGFTATRYLDNITDRIYLATKPLFDPSGALLGAGTYDTYFSGDCFQVETTEDGQQYVPNYSSIIPLGNDNFIVLPTTVYTLDTTANRMRPWTDDQLAEFKLKSTKDRLELLNTGVHTCTPLHLRLDLTATKPLAGSFNLLQPSLRNLHYQNLSGENTTIPSQMFVQNVSLTHLNYGTGGYRLLVQVYRTEDIANLSPVESDINHTYNLGLTLEMFDATAATVYLVGNYLGTDATTGYMQYEFLLQTDYRINKYDQLHITNCLHYATGVQVGGWLPLEGVEDAVAFKFFLRKARAPYNDYLDLTEAGSRPYTFANGYLWLTTQQATLNLGKHEAMLFNNVTLNLESETYETVSRFSLATYQQPVYYRYDQRDVDEQGIDPRLLGTYKLPLEERHLVGELVQYDHPTKPICLLQQDEAEPIPLATDRLYYAYSTPLDSYESLDGQYRIRPVDLVGYLLGDGRGKSPLLSQVARRREAYCTLVQVDGRYQWQEPVPHTPFLLALNREQDLSVGECPLEITGDGALYAFDYDTLAPGFLEGIAEEAALDYVNVYVDQDSTLAARQLVQIEHNLNNYQTGLLQRKIFPWRKLTDINTLSDLYQYQQNKVELPSVTGTPAEQLAAYQQSVLLPVFAGWCYLLEERLPLAEGQERPSYQLLGYSLDSLRRQVQLQAVDFSWQTSANKFPWEVTWYSATTWQPLTEYTVTFDPYATLPEDYPYAAATAAKLPLDLQLTEQGEQIVNRQRRVGCDVSMLHVDYKLTQAEDKIYRNYRTDVLTQLESYFTKLTTAKRALLEKTDLYYAPTRTMGLTTCYDANGYEFTRPLEVSLGFRLYAKSEMINSVDHRAQAETTIENLLVEQLRSGSFSLTKAADAIRVALANMLDYVDVLGVDEDPKVQTIRLATEGTQLLLKRKLTLFGNGMVTVRPALNLVWIESI